MFLYELFRPDLDCINIIYAVLNIRLLKYMRIKQGNGRLKEQNAELRTIGKGKNGIPYHRAESEAGTALAAREETGLRQEKIVTRDTLEGLALIF
jgi:hypothetical protein